MGRASGRPGAVPRLPSRFKAAPGVLHGAVGAGRELYVYSCLSVVIDKY